MINKDSSKEVLLEHKNAPKILSDSESQKNIPHQEKIMNSDVESDNEIDQNVYMQMNNEKNSPRTKRSKWRLIGSAIIISIACIDPGNLQGKISI